ncbi:MAG TPA: thioredoxin-dependent thiol peroxidase [Candidatus Dormibacteraeota bacterium]|nr:thioredoxin-dependent thiol peroxidase [Candidatus Dormibacteraeota bacterium]
MRLRPGDPAPDFRLPDQDGRPVDLRDLRGRRVVMYFYPRDGTPGCTVEACQFNDALAGFTALGVEVLGVSGDDAASHRSFREGHGLRFRLLTDADHRVATAYGAFGERRLYGRPVTGVIRSTFLIDEEGRVAHAWYGVRANGHAARVLAEAERGHRA